MLKLTGSTRIFDTADTVYDALASDLMDTALRAVGKHGSFHLALSGGSTPEPFYMRLMIDPRYRAIPWDQTHIWIVDERRVPEDDDRSNVRMIRETLSDHAPMRSRQVHAMPVMDDDAAAKYDAELRKHLPEGRLDFVLLGMGDDAHTASLFPHSPALDVTDAWVAANDGQHVTPPPRLTMTYPLLNAAHDVAVLLIGHKKAATLKTIAAALASDTADIASLPITGVSPAAGRMQWFLDAPAAGESDD